MKKGIPMAQRAVLVFLLLGLAGSSAAHDQYNAR